MDLPPLSNALPWLTRQAGRTVGTRMQPDSCLLALWLRDWCGAADVYVDDQVIRLRWASGWRMCCPTPPDYAGVIERLDWSCGPGGTMAIHVCEARKVIEGVLRETLEDRWDGPSL